ncbi:hypothetical protein HUT16_30140 [Kitasatospora sp. NA04385]|uniref:hypothetical protein n=1 Tax=Kitasatospora sp. NA04385 TaxID=2742135 RepID=UPI001590A8D7|nr:hypothetical protein [Kitasatospora sp. NA04385]QKW22785.1 hypothetical protein HUT16_30140 [Kitasatospora sp. NA04385]
MNRTTRRITQAVIAGSMAAVSLLTLAGSAAAGSTTELSRGEYLSPPSEVIKRDSSGHMAYSLQMQPDGNLVLYRWENGSRSHACWASGTYWAGDKVFATYQDDGNFVVYLRNGAPKWPAIWASNTVGGAGSNVSINSQGVLYVGLKPITGPC